MSAAARRAAGIVLCASLACAAPGRSSATTPTTIAGFDVGSPLARWELPDRLREASGLAISRPGFVIVHTDERGVLVEVDYRTGRVGREWWFGDPVVRGDYEGVEVVDGVVTLMASDGRLWSGRLSEAGGAIAPWTVVDTGLGRRCELEGLAHDGLGHWVIPCKRPTQGRQADTPTSLFVLPRDAVDRPRELAVTTAGPRRRLGASAVTTTAHGDWLVLFGPERAIGLVTREGRLTTLLEWPSRRHRQPEGITVDGSRLIIADEGAGRIPAVLTVYGPPQHE